MNEEINHILLVVASSSIGIIITMLGFWLSSLKNIPSRSEVKELVASESPYLQDRQFIMEKLSINKETLITLSTTLQKVIDVMSDLKIQIATLGKTLETLEERIERSEH